MLKIKDYQETIDRLKPYLVDYLEEFGVKARNGKHFKCFNPNEHDVDGDDMSVHPDGHIFHCFACGLTGNIMLAAHYHENKPIQGRGYIPDNVLYLCSKFGVEAEFEELTDAEKYELDIYRAYSRAARIVSRTTDNELVNNAINQRGWSPDWARRYGIGTVPSFELYQEELKKEFLVKFLKEIDLDRRSIFNENSLIFTICDEGGSAVGFAARDLLWEQKIELWENNSKRGRKPPKYVNLTTSGTRDIYQKSSRLYGLHHALRTRESTDDALFVVEGYTDWATLVFNGIDSCAALGGTAFTRLHLSTIKRTAVKHIVLALDGDKAGQDKVASLLLGRDSKPGILSGVSSLRIEVMTLPEGEDPDSFVRTRGADAWLEWPRQDAFEWVLGQFDDGADAVEVCNKAIPLIFNEENLVKREQMCVSLSRYTSISLDAIKGELERLVNIQEADLSSQKEEIVKEALREAARNPDSSTLLLQEALSRLGSLGGQETEASFSAEEVVEALDTLKEKQELDDGLAGYKLDHFTDIEQKLNGDWRQDVLMVVGGKANTGKTAFMSQLALDLVMSNPEALILFHTIDDTRGMITNRWLTQLSVDEAEKHGLDITINKISKPKYFTQHVNHNGEHKDLMFIRDHAYQHLRSLHAQGRLVCKDHERGQTLSYAQLLVGYYRKKYPDRPIIYFLDNFHNLADWQAADERIRFKKMANFIKLEIAMKYHATVIATMEYTKLGPLVRPNNTNIAESVAMEFRANFIGHLFCDVEEHVKAYGSAEKAEVFHGFEGGIGHKKPTVELIWGKNKITDYKESTYYDFHPAKSLYLPVDEEVIRQRKLAAKDQDTTGGYWENGQFVRATTPEGEDVVPF